MAVMGARPVTGIWIFGRRPRPRARPAQRTRGRRVAAGQRRREMTNISGFLVTIAAAAGLALFYLTQSSQVAATGYQIDSLQATLAQRHAEYQQLVWEIGRARSPAEIEERARRGLRLVPIEDVAIRFAMAPAVGAAAIDPKLTQTDQ